MKPPNALPYWLIGGVIVVSFIAPAIVGFADAWFVPLAVIPFALLYLAYDRRLRKRGGE